jgi:hypothetical protein
MCIFKNNQNFENIFFPKMLVLAILKIGPNPTLKLELVNLQNLGPLTSKINNIKIGPNPINYEF